MYFIVDSVGYSDDGWKYEYQLAKRELAPDMRKEAESIQMKDGAYNRFLKDLCRKYKISNFYRNRDADASIHQQGIEEIAKYIDYVHGK